MKFIFCINHQPLNYCLMSKIRITNNYKTVLKYCQNEFVVYINFIFFNPHELVVIPLRFFQDNWQTTAQEICYISQHFDRTGFQKNLYIVRFYFFFISFVCNRTLLYRYTCIQYLLNTFMKIISQCRKKNFP